MQPLTIFAKHFILVVSQGYEYAFDKTKQMPGALSFILQKIRTAITAWKVSKCAVFSGLYFPLFELNTKIYSVNLRIQSEYGKILTRRNSVFGHFSRSESLKISSTFKFNLISHYYLAVRDINHKFNTRVFDFTLVHPCSWIYMIHSHHLFTCSNSSQQFQTNFK